MINQKFIKNVPPYLFTLVVALVICYLTLVPEPFGSRSVRLFPGADKVVHGIMFAALAGAVYVDRLRVAGHRGLPAVAVAIVASVAAGGIVELLQWKMDLGRSGDWADFGADTLGAVCGAFAAYWLASRVGIRQPGWAEEAICLERPSCATHMKFARNLYHGAFPPEERRPWNQIEHAGELMPPEFGMTMVMLGKKPCGFITSWNFGRFTYVEHFAVDPSSRGHGVGARALREFVSRQHCPVVLEVEPESAGEMARRRIGFYKRCGFKLFDDYDYIQPPYSDGLPSVPLKLMSTDASLDPSVIASTLHAKVYGVDSAYVATVS